MQQNPNTHMALEALCPPTRFWIELTRLRFSDSERTSRCPFGMVGNQVNQAETNANPFSAPRLMAWKSVAPSVCGHLGRAALAAEEERMQSGCPAGSPMSPVCIQGVPGTSPVWDGAERSHSKGTGRQVTSRERERLS